MANPVRNAVLLSACTIGAGATLMHFFDPNRGHRRRALVRDKAQSLAKDSNLWLRKAGRDIGNRARGFAAETRSRFSHQPPSDEVLTERVRSRLGRYPSPPAAIDVSVKDGIVTLRGDVLASEVRDVVSCVYSMRDVADVHNQLTAHADTTAVPGLQGDGERHKPGMLPKRLARRTHNSGRYRRRSGRLWGHLAPAPRTHAWRAGPGPSDHTVFRYPRAPPRLLRVRGQRSSRPRALAA
ncbi:MAG: BON domain-containing protein [Candidatus Acidiferrales bacterium]